MANRSKRRESGWRLEAGACSFQGSALERTALVALPRPSHLCIASPAQGRLLTCLTLGNLILMNKGSLFGLPNVD